MCNACEPIKRVRFSDGTTSDRVALFQIAGVYVAGTCVFLQPQAPAYNLNAICYFPTIAVVTYTLPEIAICMSLTEKAKDAFDAAKMRK
jgi:hypothetical protein